MKYRRLTKEQFEALHIEFAKFLASQSITSEEWRQIKKTKPEMAEQELDVFSDLIWEGVLKKVEYLQNASAQQLFLFQLGETEMNLIMVKVTDASIDLTSEEGFAWLQKNIKEDSVEIFTAAKAYSEDKNKDIFDLIRQGGDIVDGKLYSSFKTLMNL